MQQPGPESHSAQQCRKGGGLPGRLGHLSNPQLASHFLARDYTSPRDQGPDDGGSLLFTAPSSQGIRQEQGAESTEIEKGKTENKQQLTLLGDNTIISIENPKKSTKKKKKKASRTNKVSKATGHKVNM